MNVVQSLDNPSNGHHRGVRQRATSASGRRLKIEALRAGAGDPTIHAGQRLKDNVLGSVNVTPRPITQIISNINSCT